MNAFTSQDYTGYYIKAPKEKFANSIEILSDMFLNSVFEKKEIDKERGVIIEEKRMYDDQPMDKVTELFDEKLFNKHELGRAIVGSIKSINNIKRKDILEFLSKYGGENTIVVIAGAINKQEAFDKVGEHFSSLKKGKELQINEFKQRPVSKEIYNIKKEVNQTHLMIGGFAPNRHDENRFIFKVGDAILSKGFRSRLFQVIRDELGLAYYVYSQFDQYQEIGNLKIGLGVENTKVEKAVSAVIKQTNEVAQGNFSDEELARAKNYLIGQLTTGLETSDDIASWYGQQLLLNKKILSIEEVKKKVLSVTREEIVNIFGSYINENNLLLTSVSPHKKLDVSL